MKRMSSWFLVMMGAFVLGGGFAVAQGKGEKKESPAVCEAECKADVKNCVVQCQKRSKTSASDCARVCNMVAQECAKDCRQGGGD
ncbi:hypothetical protein ATI61_105481 [Archangium gephyra]|uniref:Uncharacterized protein n=1 Tax=Archangium gephyra TaxID=48 RepID=A0AAC8QFN3_9BACT|nr:hypothetical protein [Archangium gephyra]AKJ06533.1 Hypothetical protein AA314_08159 [Archangium gephyra]REG32153.1 hypothetical protein ATI61_105481 [Archangium gephyra]